MLEIDADEFSRAIIKFTEMRMLISRLSELGNSQRVIWQQISQTFDGLDAELLDLDAHLTAKAVEDLISEIKGNSEGILAFILSTKLADIQRRFLDEMQLVKLFVVNREKVRMFAEGTSFLDIEAQQKFPHILFDCDESGKCFALSRYTACVFHIMRAAEAVAATIAQNLGATSKNQNGETLGWGILTANIKNKIDSMPKGKIQDEWHGVLMYLHSCNRAFRTKTAHPEATYTADQARDALTATQAFIKSVAALI